MNKQDNQLVSTDKKSVIGFLKNMEKINNLQKLQETLSCKFQEYRIAKERIRKIKKEIKNLLDSSKEEKSIVDEITSEIFDDEK